MSKAGDAENPRDPVCPVQDTFVRHGAAFSRVVDRLAETLTNAERRTLAGAGHVPHVTNPDEFAMIREFIQGR